MLVPKETNLPLFSRATMCKQTVKTESYDPITHTLRAYSVMERPLPSPSPKPTSHASSPLPPLRSRQSSLPPISLYQPPRYQTHRILLSNPLTGEILPYHKSPPLYVRSPREVQPYDILRRQDPATRPRMSVDIRKELREVQQRKF